MTTLTKCEWCSAEFPVELTACPRCGASADVQNVLDSGGWVEAPGMKDMAEVQIGRSRAQIEGVVAPVVDLDLADGDSIFCTFDKLLWHEGKVKLSVKKDWGASFGTSLPSRLLLATGPGRVAFSHNHAGELIAMPLDAGEIIVSREHHMLLATANTEYDGHNLNLWYQTRTERRDEEGKIEYETETHYPVGNYEQFTTKDDQPGLVLLHAKGNVFLRKLADGEVIDVAPHSLLAYRGQRDPTLLDERTGPMTNRWHHFAVRLQGPGTAWIQSGAIGATRHHGPIYEFCQRSLTRDF